MNTTKSWYANYQQSYVIPDVKIPEVSDFLFSTLRNSSEKFWNEEADY